MMMMMMPKLLICESWAQHRISGISSTVFGKKAIRLIGNSVVDLDKPGVITVKGKQFKLTRGLWELLTRNDVDTGTISPNDIQRYKRILKLTSAHLSGYEPDGNIKISRGVKYVVISNLFPSGMIKHRWDKY
jgi:hypothetical protein